MTTPNEFTHADLVEAREIVKAQMCRSFHNTIDRGEMDKDGIGIMERARAEVIRRRINEESEHA